MTFNYRSQHWRVLSARGKADTYQCECGAPALQWAYQHGCPDEQAEERYGSLMPFCPHVECYTAMCVGCHRRLDLTDQARANMSRAGLGRVASAQTRAKMSARRHTTATRALMSTRQKGKPNRGIHTRWHTNRGLIDPECVFC